MQISYCIYTKVLAKNVFNQKRREIGAILRSLCKWKEVEIIEAEIFPEHVHMLRLNTTKTNSEWVYGIFKSEKNFKNTLI